MNIYNIKLFYLLIAKTSRRNDEFLDENLVRVTDDVLVSIISSSSFAWPATGLKRIANQISNDAVMYVD